MAVDRNYKRTNLIETKLSLLLQKEFKKQSKYLEDNLERLVNQIYKINQTYDYLLSMKRVDPLEEFWYEMGMDEMIKKMVPVIRKAVNIGGQRNYKKFKKLLIKYSIPFDTVYTFNYSSQFAELQLSDYKGSINATTKIDVIETIKTGLDNNSTYSEIAKNISNISETLFGKARAKTIACTEIGRAYEYGNNYPVKELQKFGLQFEKKRSTVKDSKVRPHHSDNENEGRVPFDYVYPATGTSICGEGVEGINCRCTMLYRTI